MQQSKPHYNRPGQKPASAGAGGQQKAPSSKPTHTLKVKVGEKDAPFEVVCNLFESTRKDTGEVFLKGGVKDAHGNTTATYYIFPRTEKPK
jgi:hypothetical protein